MSKLTMLLTIVSLLLSFMVVSGQSGFFCDRKSRPLACNSTYAPVCTFPESCSRVNCNRTAINACDACRNTDVNFYVTGDCSLILAQSSSDSDAEGDGNEEEVSLNQATVPPPIQNTTTTIAITIEAPNVTHTDVFVIQATQNGTNVIQQTSEDLYEENFEVNLEAQVTENAETSTSTVEDLLQSTSQASVAHTSSHRSSQSRNRTNRPDHSLRGPKAGYNNSSNTSSQPQGLIPPTQGISIASVPAQNVGSSVTTIQSVTNSTQTSSQVTTAGAVNVANSTNTSNSTSTEICPTIGVFVYVNKKFVSGKICCGHRSDICPDNSPPVCTNLYQCAGSQCQVTYPNYCQACRDPNSYFYVSGPCQSS